MSWPQSHHVSHLHCSCNDTAVLKSWRGPDFPEKHKMMNHLPFRKSTLMLQPVVFCRASGSVGLWVQHTGES